VRVPPPSDLHQEPPLGALVLLEIAAAVAANTLRARHVQIEGDFFDDEGGEVTMARVLACECEMLCNTLREYRRLVVGRLAAERARWPF
jgi:hypothetical protein